jgi:nitrate/TMAO reductase-like tetraheme cytochrome c subunit
MENVITWATVGGVAVALLAVLLIVSVAFRQRAWKVLAPAKWVLLFGLLVLPSMTMLLGNVVGFHKSHQSCAQCHTMDPWVADMKDPKSSTLAALHYQRRWINEDQCYTCHTGYGFTGNLKAKIGGLSHVTHYYITGVPAQIRIKEPFPPATCLHCHADTAKYLKIDQHVDSEMKPKIEKGELSCFECHASPHPRKKP